MDKLHLEIVTPQGLVFANDVKMVVLPGKEGEFGILPGHASMVSLLKVGLVEIENLDGSKDLVAIDWGYAEVEEGKVNVLVDGAVYVGGNTDSEIAVSIQEAKELVRKMGTDDSLIKIALSKIESSSKF